MQKKTVRIDNPSRHSTLLTQGRVADSFWTRLRGLIGVRSLPPGGGLLIKPANQVHTHFMAMAIDVLYVNADNVVVDIEPTMPPWRIGRRRPTAHYVLELPSGAAARAGAAIGDRLTLSLQQAP